MNLTLFQQAQQIFEAVVDLPLDAQAPAVRSACGADAPLRELVVELLALDEVEEARPARQWRPAVDSNLAVVPGLEIERYVFEERLGAGGMAEVWSVHHKLLGTSYALKLLSHAAPELKRRLLEEGRAQARMKSANVVPVWDVLDINGVPGLLMPLVKGPPLDRLLRTHRPTPAEAAFLMYGVVSGVQNAHEQELIHRDIKPANVLIDLGRGSVVPRVADFGLVRNLTHPGETHSGVFMGTPAYAAPEQLRDTASAGKPSDVFSLGVVFYELLAGRPLFDVTGLYEALEAHQRPIDLSAIPARLQALLGQMLHPVPAKRPSCDEILGALAPYASPTEPVLRALFAAAQASAPAGVDTPFTPHRSEGAQSLPPRNTLPANRDNFIGRAQEAADLAQRLRAGTRLLTVTGPGGVGKTRLATEVGRALAARADDFPGGFWFCDLIEARDKDSVLSALGRALGVAVGRNPTEAIEATLRSRGRCLLILDNLEQILGPAAELIGRWWDQTEATFLCTSRAPLRLRGEEVVPIQPMPDDAGIALFVDRARSHTPGYELDDSSRPVVAELVRMLDGLPLAIELAAARARLASPQRLLVRLSRRFKLLADRAPDRPERQRTLRATLQWSWDLLPPWVQDALAQCSVFGGSFTLEAADEILDLSAHDDDPWVEDALSELLENSLLARKPGSTRLSMLVSVREFAAEKLQDPGPIERRHCQWCARLSSDAHARDRRAERDNLTAACQRVFALADLALAEQCVQALSAVIFYQGPYREGLALLERLAEHNQGRLPDNPVLHNHHARYLEANGRLPEALAAAEAAVSIAHAAGDHRSEASMRSNLSHLQFNAGRLSDARETVQGAMALCEQHGLHRLAPKIMEDLSRLHFIAGDHDAAVELLSSARDANREQGNRLREASNLNNLGLLHRERGHNTDALRAFAEAIALFREHEQRRNEVLSTANKADVLHRLGRIDEALETIEQGIALARALDDHDALSLSLGALGAVHLTREDLDRALAAFEESLAISRVTGHADRLPHSLHSCAGIYLSRGDLPRALAAAEEGLALTQHHKIRWQEPIHHTMLGRVQAALGRRDEARVSMETAADIARDFNPVMRIEALCWLARLLLQDDRAAAEDALAQARETSQPLQNAGAVAMMKLLQSVSDEVAAAR